MTQFLFLMLLFLSSSTALAAELPEAKREAIVAILDSAEYERLKPLTPGVFDDLLVLYPASDISRRAQIANALYFLSIKSERARELLLKDVYADDQQLRLAVQWALGRVSDDEIVVKTLLDTMQNDPNPLFRDKAACALAHDQVHLTEKQNLLLLEGLILALNDEKDDVRRIAILALQIKTGQTKDFDPSASHPQRAPALARWEEWLTDYKRNVD
jgi:HEAT repeat protein